MKIYKIIEQIQLTHETSFKPCITLAFQKLPEINPLHIQKTIQQIEPLFSDVQVYYENDTISLTGKILFENHEITMLANPSVLPKNLIETCINTAHWQKEFKQKILTSNASLTLVYSGKSENPVENYLALYKVAAAFFNENLLGIIIEPAWTYHPAGLLPKLIFNNMINLCRNSPPFLLWTGFIKTNLDLQPPFYSHSYNCFFSKGHHVFGIPDLVYYADNANPLEIKKLFNEIVEYVWHEKKELLPGDCIGFNENEIYELLEPDESFDFLKSPTKTLWLKKINLC